MADLQWAPGFDNEASYEDVLVNKAGQNTAMASNVSYSVYKNAADGSVKAKGAGSFTYEMINVTFAQYENQRKTVLGFSDDPDDVSKEVTATAPDTYNIGHDNWNCMCVHRPGSDTVLSEDGQSWASVRWLLKIVEAT